MESEKGGSGEPMTHREQQLPWKEFAVFSVAGHIRSRAEQSVMNGLIYGQGNNRVSLTGRLNFEFPVQWRG